MTAVLTPPEVEPDQPERQPDLKGSKRYGDKVFTIIALVAGMSVLAILVLIADSTTKEAWPIFREKAGEFLFTSRWAPNEGKFGSLAFVYGTLLTSAIALVFAVPVSIGIALFMTEVAPGWLKRPVVALIDLLAVVPSVVFGLWGVLVLAEPISDFYQRVSDALSPIPVVGRAPCAPVSSWKSRPAGESCSSATTW